MRALFLFALLSTLATPSSADVLIDDFTTGLYSRDLLPVFPQASDTSTQSGSMLGGTRDTFFDLGLVSPPAIAGHLEIGSGMSVTAAPGSQVGMAVQYFPASVDLSGEGRFRVSFASSSGPLNLLVEVFSPTGSSGFSIVLAPSSIAFDADIPLAALLPLGSPFPDNPVDLAHVNRLIFQFDGTSDVSGQSFQVGAIRAVPEPATWISALAGMSCAVLIGMRRRVRLR